MANFLTCEGLITQSVEGFPDCSTGWIIKPEPVANFQSLIDLLTFSPEICAQLVGGCAVLFVMGYSFGFVARMLTRR